MLQNAKRLHLIIGGVVGLNLLVAAGAAAGVVPRPASDDRALSVQAANATLDTVAPADSVPEETTTTAPPETTVPPTTTPPTTAAPRARVTTTVAPVQQAAAVDTTPPPTEAPAATVPARVNPTSTEVMAAVAQIKQRFPLYSPTEAQAREFGNAVCSAFDQGQSYSQVQAAVLAQVAKIPLIKVPTSDVDFAIRTAVQLFCPAHASRLP